MRRRSPSARPCGVKSTSRLTKLKRTPRTPAACISCSSRVADAAAHGGHAARLAVGVRDRHRPSRGCRRRGRWPARSRCARSRGGRAARTAVPCWRRTACTCARARRETARPGRTRGSAHPRCRRQLEARLAGAGDTSRASRGSCRIADSGFAFVQLRQRCDRPRCANRRCARTSAAPLVPNTPASARSATHACRSAVPAALQGSRPASRTVAADLAHLFAAPAAVLDHALEEVGALRSPSRCRGRSRAATRSRRLRRRSGARW